MPILATPENTKPGMVVYYTKGSDPTPDQYAVVKRIDHTYGAMACWGLWYNSREKAIREANTDLPFLYVHFDRSDYPLYLEWSSPDRKPGDELWRVVQASGFSYVLPVAPGTDPLVALPAVDRVAPFSRTPSVIRCDTLTLLRIE